MAENKRTTQRYDVNLPIDYGREGNWKSATTRNISLGGAQIESDEKFPMGARVDLKFVIPTQREPIEVSGQVRWGTESTFGVQFDGLRARDVWALNKYFEKLAG